MVVRDALDLGRAALFGGMGGGGDSQPHDLSLPAASQLTRQQQSKTRTESCLSVSLPLSFWIWIGMVSC